MAQDPHEANQYFPRRRTAELVERGILIVLALLAIALFVLLVTETANFVTSAGTHFHKAL